MAPIRLSTLDWASFALLIVGAMNWLLIGVADVNAVMTVLDLVFRPDSAEVVARAIYILVGLSGLYLFYPLFRISQRAESRA